MPRARNETVGPEADVLDAARTKYDTDEAVATASRVALQAAIVGAIARGMPVAEAARRSGYTREYVSKMWTAAQREFRENPTQAPIKRAVRRPSARPAGGQAEDPPAST